MTVGEHDDDRPGAVRIGEAAAASGVSTRTLRFYEEIGLLEPSGRSTGGARRYGEADLARLQQIRDLQEVLGFDLGEIKEVLRCEDALGELRSEYRSGAPDRRRREILGEASAINAKMRAVVAAKQQALAAMQRELESKAARYRALVRELDRASAR
ncbi:MAG: MerR family transcriptional regulator [Actinomycetota bacterium]|nr:MerR family transcriptional regulator [Actinomycetota bacterium]